MQYEDLSSFTITEKNMKMLMKFTKVRGVQKLSLHVRTGPEKDSPGPPHVGWPTTASAHAGALSSMNH